MRHVAHHHSRVYCRTVVARSNSVKAFWETPDDRTRFLEVLFMGHVIVIAVLLLAFFFNVVFFSSPKVLGTIFVSITDLPTFKNEVFS